MGISSVIKYEGNNNVFVWKHPMEDFNTTSQLIVHETQEAILFRNGQALDMFVAGRYTLNTENIPLLNTIVNISTGGVTPYHCEVYFINKVDLLDIRWGTSNPVPIQDPLYNIIIPVGASGQFGIQIDDSRKFLVKLVGTINEFNQTTLTTYFRGLLLTRIKDYISKFIIANKISFIEIHSCLNAISTAIERDLANTFAQYGIRLVNFFVNAIVFPENDPGYIRIKEALAKKAEMSIVGYDYKQERTYNILEKAAQNEGAAGSVMGAGMGLGMGINMGQVISEAMNGIIKDTTLLPQKLTGEVACANCGELLPALAKFCFKCGSPLANCQNELITCLKCNLKTPKGGFCIHCGQKLAKICMGCGSEMSDAAKFCKNCGAEIGGGN